MTLEANVGALHDNLLSALGTAIVSGEYPPGAVLTLDGVSAHHGVSRSVAREAIRVLESMGLVASRRRVGITIQPAQKWNVFDPQLIRWRLGSGDRAAQLVSFSELRRGFEPAAAAGLLNSFNEPNLIHPLNDLHAFHSCFGNLHLTCINGIE